MKQFCLTFPLLFCLLYGNAQVQDSLQNHKRLVGTGGIAFVGATHIGLNQLWYADYPRSSFHFINDNKDWLQMDKLGHTFSSYYLGLLGVKAMKWAGYPREKAIILGGLYGTFFQTPIEIQDGFSKQWGASLGDIMANSVGTALVIGQELLWDNQRIKMKYSYSRSSFAKHRPNILGSGLTEEFLKDYNGQTYWLSANIFAFLPKESMFPKWLNFSVGYGADGMLGGKDNIWEDNNGNSFDYSRIKRFRQFYIAPDIDLTRIKTNKKGIKFLFLLLNSIKFPLPTIEFNKYETKFHPIHF